ncbi:hypothetical protein G6F46_009667 [Rhizopus delemar]|uniref:Uncharacterized protein n=2 Tax=Rhizopus TaxID=4842 RepID=A0A9P6YWL2_9FUNG|nr:hypothetical protein G6F55_008282 [Rhizopus delemar]KAG1540940.1 hypothetical protein G6F51_008211 [Rhizopus arrhizus]KAG1491684.1 hypothetical protein G6F54_009841 [Rhizopus delemar]KAG1506801.1 hypothetical protein G6F53_009426 [Rhizopus delemar]KAG1551161.1 hypothetical protein G6F49_009068 [Rhizopus delemar]
MTDECFPIGIHIDRLNGYLFSLRYHAGVYIASKLSDEYIFIPQNEQEYQHFLFNTHLIQILFHLKKHSIDLAKCIRRTASNRNMWFVHDIHF